MIHATIAGDGSTNQDVVVSGHIYEGLIKQGANDDNSGAAHILEMGRAYIQLVKEGKLPKPKRTIHFLFVQEISGTNAWLNAHPDLAKRIIADLNYDMEGLRLSTGGAQWLLMRTPDSFPTFLNDICQNFLEFVAEITRERVRYRANGYAPALDVLSPNGSRDPFNIKVDKYYGSSDHATYMQHGIPAVIFNTWPDPWYHSSQDTPDKLDPTQFKRAAVVSIGAMTVLATADDPMAVRVVADALGRGAERMTANQRKGLGYIGDVTERVAARAGVRRREGRGAPSGEHREGGGEIGERAVRQSRGRREEARGDVRSADRGARRSAHRRAQGDVHARGRDVEGAGDRAGAVGSREAGGAHGRRAQCAGGGGGARWRWAWWWPGGGRGGAPSKIPGHMTGELNAVLGRGMTVLEIHDFISGEFEPVPLQDVWDYVKAQETAGYGDAHA